MAYVAGLVAAVPAANKEAYRKHATNAASLFKEFGASRIVEAWGDDVPDGQVTDFKRAVRVRDDEVVVFHWLEYPTKQAADAAYAMMSDPRMQEIFATMPFDGQRMIFGGFVPFVDEAGAGAMGYVDGFLVPVPTANKDAYREMAEKAAAVFKAHGATRIVEAWADDVPDGKLTDYRRAVKATGDEAVVYSWIEWPSKQGRDEGWKRVMATRACSRRRRPGPSTASASSMAASLRSSTLEGASEPARPTIADPLRAESGSALPATAQPRSSSRCRATAACTSCAAVAGIQPTEAASSAASTRSGP
jgi:uncharacterized protein YbaA (DUF1428 family)